MRLRATVALLFVFAAVTQFCPVRAEAQTISSFTPAKGPLSTVVTITGSGFTGISSVKFGGVAATFTVVSNTSIKATVPNLAVTGKIAVGSVLSATNFTVLPGIALTPAVGPPTASTSVAGSGFGANELVDIYEGSTDVVLAVTNSAGTFSGVPINIPNWAAPGAFWISAAGRHSQLAAQKSFNVRTDWLNPRRTVLGSGWNRYENVLDGSSVRQLEMAWTTAGANFLSNGPPGVIVAAGLIISLAPVNSTLTALRTDGSQAWSQPLNTSFFSAPAPAAGSGVVVAASTDGKVHAYNLATGAPKWSTTGPSDTGNGSPVVWGSTVFAPGATALQTFNLSTGAPGWTYTGPCTGSVSTPAISGGTVVFTCSNSSGAPVLVSLSTDGTFYHWLSTAAGATSAPALYGGSAYLVLGGNFVSYSLSAFNSKWALTPPFSVSTDPAVGDGIAATCGAGGIWAVNAGDGSTRFSNPYYTCSAALTIANGLIYEPRNGDIVIWDEYGDLIGRLGTGGNAGPVTVVDGSVYTGDSIAGVDRFALPAAAATKMARPDLRMLSPDMTLTPYSVVQTADR